MRAMPRVPRLRLRNQGNQEAVMSVEKSYKFAGGRIARQVSGKWMFTITKGGSRHRYIKDTKKEIEHYGRLGCS